MRRFIIISCIINRLLIRVGITKALKGDQIRFFPLDWNNSFGQYVRIVREIMNLEATLAVP